MNRLIIAVALLASSQSAQAFHEVESFARSSNTGGGNGAYFTGSARFKGYDCGVCHVGAERRISVELRSELTSGRYQPGLIYSIEVRLVGEHRGLDSAFNPNTFAADITDASGRSVGSLSAGATSIVEVVDDARVAVAEGFGNGETEWSFSWFAPDTGAPATLHLALLDGDGASDPVRRFIDPLNDDLATLALPLCPTDATCEPPEPSIAESSPVGCATSGVSPSTWAWLSGLWALCLCRRGRRRAILSQS